MTATNSKPLTAERLRDLIHYDPETGAFTWLVHRSSRVRAGQKAGYVASDGYLRIGIDRIFYKGHDLAWLYMRGEFPNPKIDHENRKPADNRFDNLRQATRSQNAANKTSKLVSTKTRGTWRNPDGTWGACAWKDGKRKYLGRFNDGELAALAYDAAAFGLHGEFAILNYPERLAEHRAPAPAL